MSCSTTGTRCRRWSGLARRTCVLSMGHVDGRLTFGCCGAARECRVARSPSPSDPVAPGAAPSSPPARPERAPPKAGGAECDRPVCKYGERGASAPDPGSSGTAAPPTAPAPALGMRRARTPATRLPSDADADRRS